LWLCLGSRPVSASTDALCKANSTANTIAPNDGLAYRVAIVTGGDSGLGKAIAETLAKQGATVVIAGRDLEKCQNAIRNWSGVAVCMELNLASFKSVRAFAAEFLKSYQTLNYLINNAGTSGGGKLSFKTVDGFEGVFQINYLGPFLLTELLLPTLRKNHGWSPARIINVASTMEEFACREVFAPVDCLKDWKYLPPPIFNKSFDINGTKYNASTYGISKFALIEHAAQLAVREGPNSIQAFSVCPGFVVTGMTNTSKRNFTKACQMMNSGPFHQDPCPYTPQQGAAVIAACAMLQPHSGGWYTRYTGCSETQPVMHGFTMAMQSDLYSRSLQWVSHDTSANTLLV